MLMLVVAQDSPFTVRLGFVRAGRIHLHKKIFILEYKDRYYLYTMNDAFAVQY